MNTDDKSGSAYVRIDRITKMFGKFRALNEVSLDVHEGEFVCFLGPSGCGKTTFLRAIAGLDIQTSGTIIQNGKDVSALPPAERDFGIVFQSYALFPNLSIKSNVAFGLVNEKKASSEITQRTNELLELVGLADQGDKFPAQLSGGQQQRVALARALATSPGLLLLDEPLSALDAKVRTYLRHEVKDLQRRLGITTIMVTHDQEEALTMADRIVVMNHGVIEQVGSPTEIYRNPSTLFVADFIGAMNKVKAMAGDTSHATIGQLHLETVEHQAANSATVTLAIRPEDVLPIGTANDSADSIDANHKSKNRFITKIKETEFLGSFWRVTLENNNLGEAGLIADFSINAMDRLNITIGKFIEVELPANRLRVFS